jgi:hypothetical protein
MVSPAFSEHARRLQQSLMRASEAGASAEAAR